MDNKKKLEADLLTWIGFYNKCHELENTFEYKDKELLKCDDVFDMNYVGDITSRNVKYENADLIFQNNEQIVFEEAIDNKEIEEFNKTHDYRKLYDEYRKKCRRKSVFNLIRATLFTIILFGIIFMLNYFIKTKGYNLKVIRNIVVVFLVIKILYNALVFNSTIDQKTIFLSDKKIISYDEFAKNINNKIVTEEKYVIKKNKLISEYKNEFITYYDEKTNYIYSCVDRLKEIKKEMINVIPMPEAYSDEASIKTLYFLVHNGRADTLKEAINIMVDEKYKSALIIELKNLNYNMNYKMNQIIDTMNNLIDEIEFSTIDIVNSNQKIINNLGAIACNTASVSFQLSRLNAKIY